MVTLPWVNHRSPRWEPEPLRWLGVNAACGRCQAPIRPSAVRATVPPRRADVAPPGPLKTVLILELVAVSTACRRNNSRINLLRRRALLILELFTRYAVDVTTNSRIDF